MMLPRLVVPALAASLAALLVTAPLSTALAQADHAQKIAQELAQRRAQVRALQKCEMEARPMTPTRQPSAGELAERLPPYPPSGTGGPVPAAPDCPPRWGR